MSGRQQSLEASHQIIANDEQQFVVWPSARRPPIGWRYVGKEGSKEELAFYLQQMAVETLPTPLLITDRTMLDTHWG
jgi:MbtH protein